MKTTTLTGIDPIPVEYILSVAQSKATLAQRRPYVELIEHWGEEQGKEEETRMLLQHLNSGQEIDPKKMPSIFAPRFRQPDTARQLIEIVRKIDAVIASRQENWTWAHVMRVMVDEGIIMNCTVNRFDQLICSMVPGKGRDIVRKHGDFPYLLSQKETWPFWAKQAYLNPQQAAARSICNLIAAEFAPVLSRKIIIEM